MNERLIFYKIGSLTGTEAVSIKIMMNESLIFFKIVFLQFILLIPASFWLVKAPLKVFSYGMRLYCCISFNVFNIYTSYSSNEFSILVNQEKVTNDKV